MATHTVIQDIEAEDKFVGPLTLKQFVFAGAGVFFAYLCVFAGTRGAPILLLIFLPPSLLGFFLAIPWSKDQPTEVWVLAKLRFRMMPQVRVWDQTGMEELVTITAPKKVEKVRTNGLSQDQVKSRLKALAETIDTRGWAVKHATMPDSNNPYVLPGQQENSQRLINIDEMPGEVPEVDAKQYEDVMDDNTPISSSFSNMIETSSAARRQESLDRMDRVRRGEPIELINQPGTYFAPPQENNAGFNEEAVSAQLRNSRDAGGLSSGNMHQLKSSQAQDDARAVDDSQQQAQAQMTDTPDPDIISLANNNDLDVATISRVAKKDKEDGEVVINLR